MILETSDNEHFFQFSYSWSSKIKAAVGSSLFVDSKLKYQRRLIFYNNIKKQQITAGRKHT